MRLFTLVLFALPAFVGCRFTLDRDLAPGELRGTVVMAGVDGARTPVSGARIRVEGSGAHVSSDAKGRFVLRGLPVGRYDLFLTHGEGDARSALRMKAVELAHLRDGQAEGRDLGELVLGAVGRISGKVTSGGSLASGVHVALQGLGESHSNEAGEFTFDGLAAGNYELNAILTLDDQVKVTKAVVVTVESRAVTDVTLNLDALELVTTGSVQGEAKLAGETRHDQILVELDDGKARLEVGYTTVEGGYVTAGVPAGIYTVTARTPDHRAVSLPHVVIAGDTQLPTMLLVGLDARCDFGGTPDDESDLDGDGVPDTDEDEACRCDPSETRDTDGDGICDGADRDVDGDGVPDLVDLCPEDADPDQLDSDEDGRGDACTAPAVRALSPANGAVDVPLDAVVVVTFATAMNEASVQSAFSLSTTAGPVAGALVVAGHVATFTPDALLEPGGDYQVSVGTGARDLRERPIAQAFHSTFQTIEPNVVRPTVVAVDPEDGAVDVTLDSTITLTFSSEMDSDSVEEAFALTGPDGAVAGIVSSDGDTFTFEPDEPLMPEEQYTVTVAATAADTAGVTLGSAFVASFHTATAPAGNPPQVVATWPADGETHFSPRAVIAVSFAEGVDAGSLTTSTFFLTLDDGITLVPGQVGPDGDTFAFEPDQTLEHDTPYRAHLTTGVLSSEGVPMAQTYSWRFITGADVAQMSIGNSHACAVRSNRMLLCWGENQKGQLGDGTYDSRGTLVQVGFDRGWRTAGTGDDHSCALKETGELYCWGANDTGQLGTGDLDARIAPTPVGTGSEWDRFDLGFGFGCAIEGSAELSCWGKNNAGQLGFPASGPVTSPQLVNAEGWSQVSAGYEHACAVRMDDKTLWCWGTNWEGQLGLGSTGTEVPLTQVGTRTDWSHVSAGETHTCAVTELGELFCWGSNYYGELGVDSLGVEMAPVAVEPGRFWMGVSAGTGGTCAVEDDGSVWCFGRLGEVDGAPRLVESGAVSVSAGGDVACALRPGKLSCWGSNFHEVLGTGLAGVQREPVSFGDFTDVEEIASGFEHTCVRRSDGTIWCAGYNNYGQLGDGTQITRGAPVQVGTQTDWDVVRAGGWRTCGLRRPTTSTTGTLWCWGERPGSFVPDLVPTQVGTEAKWTSLTVGPQHACAIDDQKQAYCWGNNLNNQVHPTNGATEIPDPFLASAIPDFVELSAGERHTCGRYSDNSAVCWGKLQGTTLNSNLLYEITQFSSGLDYFCGRKTDGTITCRGLNSDGQLGDGSTKNNLTGYVTAAGSGYTTVATASAHTCATRADGSLWCWGNNDNGQLGDGTTGTSLTPVQVVSGVSWRSVTAGQRHTCGLADDKRVFCWGTNEVGALGNGGSESDAPVVPPVRSGTCWNDEFEADDPTGAWMGSAGGGRPYERASVGRLCGADVDTRLLEVPAGADLIAWAGVVSGGAVSLEIMDSDGMPLAQTTAFNAAGEIVPITGVPAGTWQLRVSQGSTDSSAYRLTTTLISPTNCPSDAAEPNEALATSHQVGALKSLPLAVCPGDEDWFVLFATMTQKALELRWLPDVGLPSFELFEADGVTPLADVTTTHLGGVGGGWNATRYEFPGTPSRNIHARVTQSSGTFAWTPYGLRMVQ